MAADYIFCTSQEIHLCYRYPEKNKQMRCEKLDLYDFFF